MPQLQADGKKIRRIRTRLDISVNELVAALAEHQGLPRHPDYIRNIELGHKQPSAELLGGIARVLGVSRDQLLASSKPKLKRRTARKRRAS